MALGGGTFTAQNKVLPGAYINFVSAASANTNLSDRGVATMPLELDWGVEGKVFEVTNEDFQKNSMKIFGYAFDDPKMKGLNDLFLGAQKLYAYRLNGGGAKAANTMATALYSGTRGNDIRIAIQKNADDADKFDVITYLGTTKVDTQTVKTAMLMDLLEQSIAAMKEIYELEKASNDVQKQEKNDRIFSSVVGENHLMVQAVSNSMVQLGFAISAETKNKVISLLKSSSDAVARGMVQESNANYLQKEVVAIKKVILQEWSEYYHKVADQKINMLQTIKGIAPEKEKADYASNKIKLGASWDFKQDNLDKMEKGLQEAETIIDSLGLGEDGGEILDFLKKVASGKASVHDLTPDILTWLMEKNMTTRLAVSFK